MSHHSSVTNPNARINVLAVVGSILLTAGICTAYGTWSSGFARYLYVERLMYGDRLNQLKLTDDVVNAVTATPPADTATIVVAGFVALLGIATIIVAVVQYFTARGPRPSLPGVPSLPRPVKSAGA